VKKQTLLLSSLLLSALMFPAQAAIDLAPLNEMDRFTRTYFALNQGLEHADLLQMQMAEGLLKEFQVNQALTIMLKLYKKYPEHVGVALQTSQAWMAVKRPEEALLVLESLESQLAEKQVSSQLKLDLAVKKSNAYLLQQEPAHALKIFQNTDLEPKAMALLDQEKYYLTYANLLYENQNYLGAYQQMSKVLELPLLSDKGHLSLNKMKPHLARLMHQQALDAYWARDYFRSVEAAREAIRLDPWPVAYVNTVHRARLRLNETMHERFQSILPALKTSILNMRYAMEIDDIQMLYREYSRFKSDRSTSFVLDEEYRPYLPQQMYIVIEQVEEALRGQGYQL